jgi:hypothetical protein
VTHEVFRHVEFPFPDGRFPPNLGAVVQRTVVDGTEPAREVIHTADNTWIVGDGVNDPNLPGAALVACVAPIARVDPAVAELAALPAGHIAERAGIGEPWTISRWTWPE